MTGKERFDFYLNQVQDLLDRSVTDENRGWWLFTNNIRTPMFMLEALSKLYSKLHDKNIFNKLQDKFKQIEDVLGDIDHYNAFEKEYQHATDVAPATLSYLQSQKEKYIAVLNEILTGEKWINSDKRRTDKIKEKLDEVKWLTEQEEMLAVKKFYHKTIESIKEFYAATGGHFTDMEEQVHELRRKLRWLSIYPQAMRGSIQLSVTTSTEPYLEKYMIPEIVNSPFNKLPEPVNCNYILRLDKNHFLTLSWLI
jgi:hypothetical protein